MGAPPITDPPSPSERAAYSAFLVTNVTKLAGIVLAVYQGFQPEPNPVTLGVALVMMTGAQALDSALSAFFGRRP